MRCRVRNSPNSVRCRFGWLAKHREGTTPITVIEKMHRVAPLVPQARAPHHRCAPASTFYARHATSNPEARAGRTGPQLRFQSALISSRSNLGAHDSRGLGPGFQGPGPGFRAWAWGAREPVGPRVRGPGARDPGPGPRAHGPGPDPGSRAQAQFRELELVALLVPPNSATTNTQINSEDFGKKQPYTCFTNSPPQKIKQFLG